MEFVPRSGSSGYRTGTWRGNAVPYNARPNSQNASAAPSGTASWSSPKPFFHKPSRFQYRGPSGHRGGIHRNGPHRPSYISRSHHHHHHHHHHPNHHLFRGQQRRVSSSDPLSSSASSPSSSSSSEFTWKRSHQHDDRRRHNASSDRRWVSPLRPRNGESVPAGSSQSSSSSSRTAVTPDSGRRRRSSPSPSVSAQKRCRSVPSSTPTTTSTGKENGGPSSPVTAPTVRRFYGNGGASQSRVSFASSSPRKSSGSSAVSGDPSKSVQLYGGKSLLASNCHDPPISTLDGAADRSEVGKSDVDPLYIGLPNYGNSCYQNATLQALFGLTPFVAESVITALRLTSANSAAIAPNRRDNDHSPADGSASPLGRVAPAGSVCPTVWALSRLMVLRQQARRRSVSSVISDLRRDIFSAIDPAFCGSQMQDANEFLLRLLDTMKDELDACPTTATSGGQIIDNSDRQRWSLNPVRSNFEYETVESYCCCSCGHQLHRRQDNISWFVNVPRRSADSAAPPTLQDALRLSVRPDRRELTCDACGHAECTVSTRISRLPRVLILQLNRYVYLSEEARKIRASVQIPRYISLNEYVSDEVASPSEWTHCRLPEEMDSLVGDSCEPAADSASSVRQSSADDQDKKSDGAVPDSSPGVATGVSSEGTSQQKVKADDDSTSPPVSSEMPADGGGSSSAELVVLDDGGGSSTATVEQLPAQQVEDEEQQLQEAIRRSLEEQDVSTAGNTAATNTSESDKLIAEYCVEDDLSRCSVDLAGDNTYRLIGVVSHYGSATHSGHYVSDVYSVARSRWYHYDDRHVSSVNEDQVIGESHQRNGYIFFYMHKSVCSQVAGADLSVS